MQFIPEGSHELWALPGAFSRPALWMVGQIFWFHLHCKDKETESENGNLFGQRVGVGVRRCGLQLPRWADLPGPTPVICDMKDRPGKIGGSQTGVYLLCFGVPRGISIEDRVLSLQSLDTTGLDSVQDPFHL